MGVNTEMDKGISTDIITAFIKTKTNAQGDKSDFRTAYVKLQVLNLGQEPATYLTASQATKSSSAATKAASFAPATVEPLCSVAESALQSSKNMQNLHDEYQRKQLELLSVT